MILIYFTTLIAFSLFLMFKVKKNGVFNMFNGILIGFMFYYIFIPFLMYLSSLFDPNIYDELVISDDINNFLLAYIFAICFITVYVLSYNFMMSNFNKYIIKEKNSFKKIIFVISIISFLIGMTSLIIILNYFGGIFEVFKYTEAIRAYGINYFNVPGYFSILKTLSPLIIVSSVFSILSLSNKKNFFSWLYMFVTVTSSLYFLVFNAGRTELIVYIIALLTLFVYKYKVKFRFIIFIGIMSIIFAFYLDDILWRLSYGNNVSTSDFSISKIISEFIFPFRNLTNIRDINEIYGYTYFSDMFSWVFEFIPSSFIKELNIDSPTPAYSIITNYYNSSSNLLGGYPIDIITLFLRQLGALGLLIISSLLGVFSYLVDKRISSVNKYHPFISINIFFYSIFLVAYSDPISNLRNRISYVFLLIIIFYFYKITPNKSKGGY